VTPERIATIVAVEQFLYREARLLDDRCWDEWLELWAPDARYRVPTRRTPLRRGGDKFDVEAEIADPDDLWWFDESKDLLALRVAKLGTGKVWAEDPPSRTRRMISNVEVEGEPGEGSLNVRSNLLLHRSRREADVETVVGRRVDVISTTGGLGEMRIASRTVLLDAAVLPVSDLALFF
jgi:3-phenylpropionate/cinnamic acid dioxygenase small subunit